MFRKITHKLQEFRRKEDGNIALEAALYLPLLLGVFAATYTLFDLFRQETVNTKAAYTVSDLISRETAALNDDYIDSIYTLGKLMARAGSDMSMRVSVIRWDTDDDRYYVDWSVERGDQMEILLPNVDADVLEAAVEFAYGGCVSLDLQRKGSCRTCEAPQKGADRRTWPPSAVGGQYLDAKQQNLFLFSDASDE